MKDVMKAARLAARAHQGQYRSVDHYDPITKRKIPYVSHCFEVGQIVAEEGFPDHTVIVALLHDVVEDTHVPLSHIKESFGGEVALEVEWLTLPPALQNDYAAKAQHQITMMGHMNDSARAVKIADKMSNVGGMISEPPSWGVNARKSYVRDAFRVVMAAEDTTDDRVKRLIERFRTTCDSVMSSLG
jgi:(p)ppGpp synthase/HD superfamily hydrolase